jgi:hypothetical protein
MVALHGDLMIRSLEGVAPLLHSLHSVQELPIVRVVVLLVTCALSKGEGDRSVNPNTLIQGENAGNSEAACIGLQNDWLYQVEMFQISLIGQGPFHLPKCKLGIPSPFSFELFRCPGCLCFLWEI